MCHQVPDLSRKSFVYIFFFCSIIHHQPTTLRCHGNIFGFVEANSFTYTMLASYTSHFLEMIMHLIKYNYSGICGNLLSILDLLDALYLFSRHSLRP